MTRLGSWTDKWPAACLAAAILAMLAAACSKVDQREKPGFQPDQKVAQSDLTLKEFMFHILQHNADEVWKWQATSYDETGEHNTFPKSPEEWETAESAALTLVEVTRPLEQMGGGDGNTAWQRRVQALRASAQLAAASAEVMDTAALVQAGDAIDEACVECHYEFAPSLELPREGDSQ